jgi:uncharacterized protein with HEPN domain
MHPKSLKWLNDIHQACELILTATADRALAEYESDRLLQSGIERNFEIIGEALGRIRKVDQATADHVPDCGAIIAFRNLLIHGYDFIDNHRVWQIIKADVPRLSEQVAALLRQSEEDSSTGLG